MEISVKHNVSVLLLILALYIEPAASSAAGQETLIGVAGRDFIMVGADSSVRSSISVTTSNVDKLKVLAEPFPERQRRGIGRGAADEQQAILVAAAGDAADGDRLLGLLRAHTSATEFEAGLGADVKCLYDGQTQRRTRRLRPGASLAAPPSSGLQADSVACLARTQIASSLRSNARYHTCLLVAGMVASPPPRGPPSASFASTMHTQVQLATRLARTHNAHEPVSTSPRSTQTHRHTHNEANQCRAETSTLQPRLYWIDEYGSIQTLEYGAHGFGSNFALSILDRGYHSNLSREQAAELINRCFQQLKTRFIINSPSLPCIKCVDKHGCTLYNYSKVFKS